MADVELRELQLFSVLVTWFASSPAGRLSLQHLDRVGDPGTTA